ncbi:PREDICTED: trypsin-2-like [Ceratosolen solmsi marchali]|uniref:Trypsin-2-like n=1 Tax=Ceratosolen solmsi marchali TaxID=326594 RepID=A0AAJ6YGH7_9HYME|nr:PREDICTED: trypsin-2-like [Ceratosolen solmsi marchali]
MKLTKELLKSEIQFNSVQKKINLPTRDVFDDNLGVLAGWGISHVDYTMISDRLLKIPATLFNFVSCAAEIPFIVYENQFCSVHSSNTTGPCPVDSGGSVVSNGELYGIISMTEHCVNGSPAVHTKVYSYLNFIRPILKQNLND